MNIPLTPDQWYETRDDRTRRITTGDFENHAVGIVLDPNCKDLFSHQCMAYIVCNIMPRWCRRLVIDLPDVESIIPRYRHQEFKEVIKNSVNSIDPYGDFQFDRIDDSKVDQILVIGDHEKTYSKSTVWIDANGWIAGCGANSNKYKLAHNHSYNPIGPSFASCLGAAQIFKQAVCNNRSVEYQKWLSLFDFDTSEHDPSKLKNPEFSTDFDYGTIYQIGCGAVGSSLDALISLTDWKMDLRLIDNDAVDYSNCNRSLPFLPCDALQEKLKVDVCSQVLENKNRHIAAIPKTYYEFTGEESLEGNPDIILSLANEGNVWSTIQDNYPPIVIHAATTQSWGINLGRHIPRSEWCVMCTFSKHVNPSYKPKCDTGEITAENLQPVFGVLPFLSPAAAVLVLAEMSKLQFEEYPINDNFIDFSMKAPFNFESGQRRPVQGCECRKQQSEIYDQLHGDSKFWKFCKKIEFSDMKS